MPIAVLLLETTVPAILEEESDKALFDAVCALPVVPADAKADLGCLQAWIETLPLPSGWFANAEEVKALQKRVRMEQDAKLVREAQKHFGTTQRELTALIGLADPQGDGSPVRRIMSAKQGLSGPGRRVLAHAVLHGSLERADEAEALNQIGNGTWRIVERSEIRAKRSGEGIKRH
ncbi:hypothetical protein [Labrenzia sp. VG12]|uniref:hypothetical protein n=1 Tax=Labrenzia sp. VG12 TaxID=2021862 RepID=UPI0012FDFD2E|nr:hypothetical protein [Labrenzia sp. VG12]